MLLTGLMPLLAAAAPASAGQVVDPRPTEELFIRAMNGEEPTPEDQRRAQQLLRDWRISEQIHPSSDRCTEPMFQALAEGRRLPPELAERAREMHFLYFTPEGRERRRARLAAAAGRSSGSIDSPQQETRAIDWLMPGMAVMLLIGGVIVSALASRRRPSDYGF